MFRPLVIALSAFCILLMLAPTSASAGDKATVPISGQALLTGASDHAGITVLFQADSPTAITDSTLTDVAGNYQLEVEQGVYDVVFRKTGWFDDLLENQYLLSATTLPAVTLIPSTETLSGDMSGTVAGPGLYYVTGDLNVLLGDTLVIEPGVTLTMLGNYEVNIHGLLVAQGTEAEPIIWTSGELNPATNDWEGIRIRDDADENSIIEYNEIHYANWALYLFNVELTIRHNLITNATNGIFCTSWGIDPSPYMTIEDCTLEFCWHYGICLGSSLLIADVVGCTVRHSEYGIVLYGDPSREDGSIIDCVLEDNFAAGIQCTSQFDGEIVNCEFRNNERAIYVNDNNSPVVTHCLFQENQLGVFVSAASPVIQFCTFVDNLHYGVSFHDLGAEAVVTSNIITGSYWPLGSNVSASSGSSFRFNCIDGGDPDFYPSNVGPLIFANANGDSCDVYFNIFSDPLLVNPAAGDFSLQGNSPCIDAGDLAYPLDPDGTFPDMGAYYFDQSTSAVPLAETAATFSLLPNFPNPFNPSTEVQFSLAESGQIHLAVYDLSGRVVKNLRNEVMGLGTHSVTWNGIDQSGHSVASGVYLLRLKTEQGSTMRKILLAK